MAETEIVFTDRYGPAGPPSLRTVCRGQCEGMGVVPVFVSEAESVARRDSMAVVMPDEDDPVLRERWYEAERENPTDDGWHFVRCPECDGSGRTKGLAPLARQHLWWVHKQADFARNHLLVRPYSTRLAAAVLALQSQAPLKAFEVGSEPQPWEGLTPYGDRLDVPHPWWWNRWSAIKVLTNMTRHQRAQRAYRRKAKRQRKKQ